MKKNIKSLFAAAAAAMLAIACTPDFPTPEKGSLPSASEVTPVIEVDQATNYVTFSIKEKGVVPMWIFGDEKVDGKTNKNYSYVGNGISLRIREAGVHKVELKVYNSNGVSLGSKMAEFSLDNTYRDPFDPTPYMKAIANTWVWDSTNDGHFGCGEFVSNPTGWWSCTANGKADMGLYDDLMTFTADGKYTYNPGKGGTVYVNKDAGFKAENKTADEDYQAPIDEYTHSYAIENSWNDAGVEEIFLVLNEGDNLSYIPHKEAYTTNTRYQFVSTKTSEIKKNFKLTWFTPTGNGGGSIAWLYSFVPYVKVATPEELLAGTDEKGKVWVMDSDADGHLGCGETTDNAAGWWGAKPNEKADFGMYDDELTFFPDGKYAFSSGKDGKVYVNTGVKTVGADLNNGSDFDMPWDNFETTYKFDGEKIVLPEGKIMGYIPNDEAFTNPTYIVTELTETRLKLVWYTATGNNGGPIAWQYIFKARDVKGPSQSIGGEAVEGGKVELSLTNGQSVEVTGIELGYVDVDFFKKDGAKLVFVGPTGDYRILVQEGFLKVIPLVNGEVATYPNAVWMIGEGAGKPQGKAPGWNTGESSDIPFVKNGDTFTATLYCTASTNIKLFEKPNWGDDNTGAGVWLTNRYASINGNGFFEIPASDGNIKAIAGLEEGWYVFSAKDTDGTGAFALTIDKKKETYFDMDGATNLWKSATITPEYWYSPADWSGGLNPVNPTIGAGNTFTVTTPDGIGGSQWMGQNKLHTNLATSAAKKYDFCCTLTADEDVTITVKLTGTPEGEGDPHMFSYDADVVLEAGVPLTIKKENLSQKEDTPDFTLIFDLGRVPAGKTVSATAICFQEHQEK